MKNVRNPASCIHETVVRLQGIDKQLNQIVDKASKSNQPFDKLAEVYFETKQAYDALDAIRKKIYHVLDRTSKEVIPARLNEMGVDRVRVPSIGRSVGILIKYSASTVDKEKGFAWLRKRGDEHIITETVNASTLAAYLRDLTLNEGVDAPDDAFVLKSYNITGMNKYNPGRSK